LVNNSKILSTDGYGMITEYLQLNNSRFEHFLKMEIARSVFSLNERYIYTTSCVTFYQGIVNGYLSRSLIDANPCTILISGDNGRVNGNFTVQVY
jgi:hypothetical protein